jgi:hypothetical protein
MKSDVRGPKSETSSNPEIRDGRTGATSDVHLHIDRLVLDGVPLASSDVPRFQAALEQELGRLFASVPAAEWSGEAMAHLDARSVHLAPGGTPQNWGRQVARSLARAIGAGAEHSTRTGPAQD